MGRIALIGAVAGVLYKAGGGGLMVKAGKFSCNVCGHRAHTLLYRKEFGRLFQCERCGLVRLTRLRSYSPVPTVYGRNYFGRSSTTKRAGEGGYQDYFGVESERRSRVHMAFAALLQSVRRRGSSALDVGCGNGHFLYWLRRHGWRAEGLEVSAYAARRARERSGAEIHVGDIRTFAQGPTSRSRYDLITLFDVLEHMEDPVRDLSLLRSMLTRGGRVFISTPQFGGTMSTAQGANYFQFKPDHLYYFSSSNLGLALRKAGFDASSIEVMELPQLLDLSGGQSHPLLIEKYSREREQLFALAG